MRGQTTIDFTIGITVFLGIILFTLTFVPGILAPFDSGGEEQPVVADRIANTLTQDMLGSSERPHSLDRFCTVEFFNGTTPSTCRYDTTDLEEAFNLKAAQNVNITLVGNVTTSVAGREQLCWINFGSPVGGDPGVVEQSFSVCPTDGILLRAGDETPERGTTITARRVVELHGETVTLEVKVW